MELHERSFEREEKVSNIQQIGLEQEARKKGSG
jgi:hypothetical protein